MDTDLGQGGQTLLLDVPYELVPWELEALLNVELGHVDFDQQALLRPAAAAASSFVHLLHLEFERLTS